MTLPRFSAETSLYETRAQYRSTGASVQTNSVMLQQLQFSPGICTPCEFDVNSRQCLSNCTSCILGGRVCIQQQHTCPMSSCHDIPGEGPGGDCPCDKFGGFCTCPPPTVLM